MIDHLYSLLFSFLLREKYRQITRTARQWYAYMSMDREGQGVERETDVHTCRDIESLKRPMVKILEGVKEPELP